MTSAKKRARRGTLERQRHEKCGYNEGGMYRANMFLLFHIVKSMSG